MLFLVTFLWGVLAGKISQQTEIKGNQIGKENTKLSLFANDMTLYINTKAYTENLLELIKEFSNTSRCKKINIQKSIVFYVVSMKI